MTNHEQVIAEHGRLEQEINTLSKQLDNLPEGKLICTTNGKYTKWYNRQNNLLNYIPKSHRTFAEQLAARKYLTLLIEDLTHEKRALEAYLKHHNKHLPKSLELLKHATPYRALLEPHFHVPREMQQWTEKPYEKNPKYPDQLIHHCLSGNMVRSKSETIIDLFLYINNIPYHYEEALTLDEHTIYPDFTILSPKTGRLVYWEHFGMMDDAEYAGKAIQKIQSYIKNGYVPGTTLLMTFETKEHPFMMEVAEEIVRNYFVLDKVE